MAHKTITVFELKVCMFVTSLDISWLASPFLTGKKKIQSQNEIDTLIKAGAQKITIDIEKSDASCFISPPEPLEKTQETVEATTTEATTTLTQTQNESVIALPESARSSIETPTKIDQEMPQAQKIKEDISQISEHISQMIESNSPVQMQDIMPVIDKTISSLCRNDQALISLLRHSKTHSKLTSHTFNVFTLSLMLATKLGISIEEQQLLGTAALLHDSGWARLPSNLFSK